MRKRALGLAGLIAATVLLALSERAFAQSTASVRGHVTDEQAAAVAGAQITVRNEATGQERTTVSDRSGDYQLSALPVGSYRLEIRSTGFQTTVVSGLLDPMIHPVVAPPHAPAANSLLARQPSAAIGSWAPGTPIALRRAHSSTATSPPRLRTAIHGPFFPRVIERHCGKEGRT